MTLKNSGRRILLALTVIMAFIGVLFVLKEQILGFLGERLVRDDRKDWRPGEFIVVLMGDLTSSRAYAGYETWRVDPNQTIVVMEENKFGFFKSGMMPPPSAAHQRYFESQGIPSSKIKVIDTCAVDSTLDEAQCFFDYLEKNNLSPKRLTLVTSFYHSSRAYWIFSHVFHKIGKKDVYLSMLPAPALDSRQGEGRALPQPFPNHLWWQREDLFLAVFNEYLKWTYWQIKGLPPTIKEAVNTASTPSPP